MSSAGRPENDLVRTRVFGRLACLSVCEQKKDSMARLVKFDCIAMLDTACIS